MSGRGEGFPTIDEAEELLSGLELPVEQLLYVMAVACVAIWRGSHDVAGELRHLAAVLRQLRDATAGAEMVDLDHPPTGQGEGNGNA